MRSNSIAVLKAIWQFAIGFTAGAAVTEGPGINAAAKTGSAHNAFFIATSASLTPILKNKKKHDMQTIFNDRNV
jgi:hypothetical protein